MMSKPRWHYVGTVVCQGCGLTGRGQGWVGFIHRGATGCLTHIAGGRIHNIPCQGEGFTVTGLQGEGQDTHRYGAACCRDNRAR